MEEKGLVKRLETRMTVVWYGGMTPKVRKTGSNHKGKLVVFEKLASCFSKEEMEALIPYSKN